MDKVMSEMTNAADLEALDALLDEVEIDAAADEVLAASEEIEELDLPDSLDAADMMALEAEIAKSEAYAEQESEINDQAAVAPPTASKPARQPRAASGNAQPRKPRDLASIAPEVFILEGDVSAMTDADKDAAKTATLLLTPTQKKIAEKFENLFSSLSANRKPSTYITDAFTTLEKTGSLTMTDLIAAYKADGYSQGTAASQAGQIMNLFDAVKIATRTKSTMVLNPASLVAQRLRDVLA